MARQTTVCIEWVGNVRIGKRGVAWLRVSPDADEFNAYAVFKALSDDDKRALINRMEYWVNGGHHNKYFHGWDGDYRNCFVFKLQDRRFFGFLCHPRPFEPRFQICVIASHTVKDDWEADVHEKDKMIRLTKDERVIKKLSDIKENCEDKNESKLDGRKRC